MTADTIIALLTLTGMEIVLGIDNIIFISILVLKLPQSRQKQARQLGITLALLTRLALLFSITWIMGLTRPFLTIAGKSFSGRDLILILGGAFLIFKATYEIHEKLEAGSQEQPGGTSASARANFGAIIIQIMILDIVFSLDSVITAVGMAQQLWIMVVSMVVAVGVMLFSAKGIGAFVHRHPTVKILALSFLLLIGMTLLMEGFGAHVNKGYIYFAMAFSFAVELLNIRFRKKSRPVQLREPT